MAARTATQSGNWSASSTWGGSAPPGDGDTATIGAFTVAVDVNTTVGTSPNDTTTKVIDKTSATGALVVAAGVTLTVKGNVGGVNGSTLTMQAGSTLTFDNTASGGTPVYLLGINVGFQAYTFNGTSGSPVTVQAVTGQTWSMAGSWGAVTATYTTFRRCSNLTVASVTTGGVTITDCTFDTCGRLDISYTGTTVSFTIERNTFTAGTHASDDVRLNMSGASNTGTRRFRRNVLAKALTYSAKFFTISQNYFGAGVSTSTSNAWDAFRLNLVYHNGLINSGNGMITPGPFRRNYVAVNCSAGNPHFLSVTALGADTEAAQNVFESLSPDLIDIGDCCIANPSATSGGAVVLMRNNLVLPSGTGCASGTALTIYNNATAPLVQPDRNTVNVNTSAVGGVGKRGAFAFAEASNGAAGQVRNLRSNLVYGTSSGQGYLGERVQGTVKDHVTAADYNWTYNTSSGDNGRGYEDKAASNTLWTAGNAAAAGIDDHQGSGDPQFVDGTRNLAAWATARGYGSTSADALTALAADPRRAADAIDYVFAGFKPQNASCRTAAHDGGCVGAANYHKAARTAVRATAAKAYLVTKYGVAA